LQHALEGFETQLNGLLAAPTADTAALASAFGRTLPESAVLLIVRSDGIEAYPTGRLLYYPVVTPRANVTAKTFAAADAAEFGERNADKALSLLRRALRSSAPAVRAEALMRMARNQRKIGRNHEALRTYESLAELGNEPVAGLPAELVARGAIADLLADSGRDRLQHESRAIIDGLYSGRWRLLRAEYDHYRLNAERWLESSAAGAQANGTEPHTAAIFSEAARWLWADRDNTERSPARRSVWVSDTPVLAIQRSASATTLALVTLPAFLESTLRSQSLADPVGACITLTDADGRVVFGPDVAQREYSARVSSATALPWTIYASSGHGNSHGLFTARGKVVIAGLAAMALLVVGGSYLIGRAVIRELRVAELQSQFVSSVSHEFRSPLTALRQMSELLVQGRVPSEELRQEYYEVLQHESGRLHRLVEGLLKFGRLQAEAMPLHLAPVDADVFVRDVVDEFRREAGRRGYIVEIEEHATTGRMSIDREALTCALWNLLDNAVKYSPNCRTVWVSIEELEGRIAIRVRDRGVGIPENDRSRIFEKFVRGPEASSLGVPGTGIGLAVTRQIVLRHGGDVSVDSTPGAGSTFTILIPATP
jgi:signal transduction histidine kinase